LGVLILSGLLRRCEQTQGKKRHSKGATERARSHSFMTSFCQLDAHGPGIVNNRVGGPPSLLISCKVLIYINLCSD
jgi:hypothetical protein